MAKKSATAAIVGGAVIGGLVLGGVGVALYLRRKTAGSTPAAGASPNVSVLSPSVSATNRSAALPTSGAGSKRAKALPTAAASAPTVSGLHVQAYSNGVAVLVWNGTLQSTYQGGDNTGYNLYRQSNGQWQVAQVEVDPPLRVTAAKGAVLGIAPTYLTPSGQEIAGGIQSVTV